jgi:hypothetical protein
LRSLLCHCQRTSLEKSLLHCQYCNNMVLKYKWFPLIFTCFIRSRTSIYPLVPKISPTKK